MPNAQPTNDCNDQPWLPMPGENQRWYSRFSEYLAMGAGRSFRAVYNHEKGNERSKSVASSWTKAAKRFEWQRRAEAYDVWRRAEVFNVGNAQDTERVKKLDVLIDALYKRTLDMLDTAAPDIAFNEKLVASLATAIDLMAKHTGGYAARIEHTGKDGKAIEVHSEEERTMRVVFYMPEIAPLPGNQDALALPGDQGAAT